MKRLLLCAALISTPLFAAEKATVTHRIASCDYMLVIGENSGYSVIEWMSGHDPLVNEEMIINLQSFGTVNALYENSDDESTFYIEDYAMTKSAALEMIVDRCQ